MAWFVDVDSDDTEPEQASPPFENLVDATLYALDLADTLARIAPDMTGRRVNIKAGDGRVELSFAVMKGGFTTEAG